MSAHAFKTRNGRSISVPSRSAFKIAFTYALVSAAYILFSDQLLAATVKQAELLTTIQMAKGWAFVLVTSCLIFFWLQREIREQLQAGDAARRSEANFRLLVEHAPDAVYVQTDGRITYLNAAALKLFGASSESQLLGRPMLEMIHPDSREIVEERIRVLNREKKPVPTLTHRYLRIDGQPVDVEVNAVSLHYLGKDGALVFARDISERRRLEETLRASERNYRDLVESANSIIIRWKPDGAITFFNQYAQSFFGYTADEILGRNVMTLVPERDSLGQDLSRLARDIVERPERYANFENENLRRNGERVWVQWSNRAICDEAGRVGEILSIGNDVTERKRAEADLRETEERFRLAFQTSPDAIALSRVSDGMYLDINEGFTKLMGYTREEAIGNTALELNIWENPKNREELVNGLMTAGYVENLQTRLRRKDGQTGIALLSARLLRIKEENVILSFARDITSRVRYEEEKAQLESRLLQAQKMEAVGTLAGGIAHDFNNILGVIVGNAEILDLSNAISDSGKEELNQILTASNRARQLVRQILAFSRHSEQRKLLISLKPVIKETAEFLRASLPATIELRCRVRPEAGSIMADPTQMQQILMNLCTNAAHAMEDGGLLQIDLENATVSEKDARLIPDAEPGEYVKISVSDTGHGIEPRVMERIFDPYFTTKGLGKGTGLGLSVVHGIVKAHDGIIQVQSEAGKGTTFHVLLPRADGVEKAEPRAVQALPGGSERILFVDDERELAEIGQKMLARLGYDVETRTSPIEALEAFRANPRKFDLIITDMTMPQLTGLKLAKKLLEIRPEIPMILITGFSDQANEERALGMGIRGFLYKPLVMQDLAVTLRKVLDESDSKAFRGKDSPA